MLPFTNVHALPGPFVACPFVLQMVTPASAAALVHPILLQVCEAPSMQL